MTPEKTASSTALTILLAGPRGFCAGVDRAVLIVEKALAKYGAPVYVRHEIVHNRHVVERLEAKGAIFVDHLSQCPDDRPVIFSAHGVPKAVPAAAQRRGMTYIDATCPLVGKVHREAERHYAENRHIVLIGHAGHPEVIGTMGQLPEGAITLLETVADAQRFTPPGEMQVAYVTQTTLSVDETAEILHVLKTRFPAIHGPNSQDICYATTNRQTAVKAIATRSEIVLVIGAPNSSNSLRLVDVAKKAGCPRATLITRAQDIDWTQLQGVKTLGVTAGASAPENLVEEVVQACRKHFASVVVEETVTATENISFKLPRELAA